MASPDVLYPVTPAAFNHAIRQEISCAIWHFKPEQLHFILHRAEEQQPDLYKQALPDLKKELCVALGARLDPSSCGLAECACFVRVVETLKKANKLDFLEGAKPEWIGTTLRAIAHSSPWEESYPGAADDWATTTVYFLSGVIKLPKLTEAFKESWDAMGVNRKRTMQAWYETYMQKGGNVLTQDMQKLLGLPYKWEDLTPPPSPRQSLIRRLLARSPAGPEVM